MVHVQQALSGRGEREVCRRVVEEARQRARRPEELPGLGEPELVAARLQDGEGRDHRGEDPGEDDRHLLDRGPGELVQLARTLGPERERKGDHRHVQELTQVREADRLAGARERPRKDGGDDHAAEEDHVQHPHQADGHVLGAVGGRHTRRLAAVGADLEHGVDGKRETHRHSPVEDQAERPEEVDAAQKAEEEGRVADRRQEPAHVADDEDEEDDRVPHVRALGVGAQHGADEEHRRARRADEVGEHGADGEEEDVVARRRQRIAGHVHAAGDREQRREQQDERDVLVQGAADALPPLSAEGDRQVHDHRDAEERRDERLVAVLREPLLGGQREDGDTEEQPHERAHEPWAEIVTKHDTSPLSADARDVLDETVDARASSGVS